MGSWALPGRATRAGWRSPTQQSRPPAAATNADAAYGLRHPLRRRHGRRGRRTSRYSAWSALETEPQPLRQLEHVVRGRLPTSTTEQGWLGRWINEYGSASDPLQAISIDSCALEVDPDVSQSGLRRLNLPVNSFKLSGANSSGSGTTEPGRNDRRARGRRRPGRATPTWIARARPTAWPAARPRRSTPTGRCRAAPRATPNAKALSVRPSRDRRLPTRSLRGARVITIHWSELDTHTNQLASRDARFRGTLRARSAPSEGPPEPRHRPSRLAAVAAGFSEFERAREGTPNAPTATARDTGTNHGAGGLMFALGRNIKGSCGFPEWPPYPSLGTCVPSGLRTTEPNAQGNLKVVATSGRSIRA